MKLYTKPPETQNGHKRRIPVKDLIDLKQGIQLDLGCGSHKQAHFVGMDFRAIPGVDIVHDLEEFPWPLPDQCCTMVLASHVLEHIKPWKFFDPAGRPCVMGEIWRIMKPDAQLMISAPYGVSPQFVQDPTHCNPLNEATLQYFDPRFELWKVYETGWQFAIEHVRFSQEQFLEAILRRLP